MAATAKLCRWQESGKAVEGLLVSSGSEHDMLVVNLGLGWVVVPVGAHKIMWTSNDEVPVPDYMLLNLRCFTGAWQSFQGGTGQQLSALYAQASTEPQRQGGQMTDTAAKGDDNTGEPQLSPKQVAEKRLAELIEAGLAYQPTGPADRVVESRLFWFRDLTDSQSITGGWAVCAMGFALIGQYGSPAAAHQAWQRRDRKKRRAEFFAKTLEVPLPLVDGVGSEHVHTDKSASRIADEVRRGVVRWLQYY